MSISVGSVAVDVVPSTRGFAEDLKAKLKGITAQIKVDADTTAMRAQIDDVTRARSATVNVNADTALAEAQIAAVAQDRSANVRVTSPGLSQAVSGMSGLVATVAILGPALIPVVAAVGGLVAALAAPIALAGGGLTIGALVSGFAIKQTKEQQKQLTELAKKVDAAKLTVDKASTPAGKKSALLTLAQDTQAYNAALAELTPAQKRFLAAQDKLKASFKGLIATAGPAIFGPLIKGMDLLAGIMPSLKPLIVGVSDALKTLLGDLGSAVSAPGFKAFLRSFGREAGSAIVTFGRIFGDFSKGLFNLFRAFGPASKGFVGGIAGTAKAFAKWSQSLGSSKSFQAFLAYVREVGPKVGDALGHIFGALGKIATALAPLGGVVLALLDGLAKFIAGAKPGQIVAIAAGLGALAIAVAALGGPVVAIPAALVAIGGALAYAYTHSEPFRKAVDAIGRVFNDKLMPALKDAWRTVLPGLQSAFDNVKDSVHKNQGVFRVLGDLLGTLADVFTNVVIPAQAQFYRVELPALGKAIGIAITNIRLMGNAWAVMSLVALESLKVLVVGATASFDAILTAADIGLGWLPGIGPKIHKARLLFDAFKDAAVASLNASIRKVQELRDELNNIKPKSIVVRVKFDGSGPLAPTSPLFGPGVTIRPKHAGATGAIVTRPTVALIAESGPEVLTPLNRAPGASPLPGGGSGPQFNVEKVVAQDVNDFLQQMQVRARQAGIGGIPG